MSQKSHFDPNSPHGNVNSDVEKALQPPRQPKPETVANLQRGGAPVPAVPPPIKLSALSVDAPEFKPKSLQQPPLAPPGLPLSVSAAEFVPRTDYITVPPNMVANMGVALQVPPPAAPGVQDPFIDSFSQLSVGIGDVEAENNEQMDILRSFTQCLMILTTNPANIREYLTPICGLLKSHNNPATIDAVIDILYEQSIYEANFRYTGARVCSFLSNELKDHPIFHQFKMQFLSRCQKDFQKKEQLLNSGEKDLITLCGLTLFMGELFLNVAANASGSDHTARLKFLPGVLTDLLLTLLSAPSDTTIKTSCQLLKLTGGPIEENIKTDTPDVKPLFERVFVLLQSLDTSLQISQNMKSLIKSVLTLRQNNWGQPESSSSQGDTSHINHSPPQEYSQSEPVFYDICGKTISRAEAGYQEEEEEDLGVEDYVLTEEEEREFLIWQEETSVNNGHYQMNANVHPGNQGAQPIYGDGSGYQQWSTGDGGYQYPEYHQGYYNSYSPYGEEDCLNEEMEKAYEEFLSSQQN